MIAEYKNPLISGKTLMCHPFFVPALDLFCQYLKVTGCSVLITSSFREDTNVKGAIVTPAQMSNHLVGCAFDCNIFDKKKKLWNSEALGIFAPEHPKYDHTIVNEILQLLMLVRRSSTLRWGGDFRNNPDVVHFDNAINIKNEIKWKELYKEINSTKTKTQ